MLVLSVYHAQETAGCSGVVVAQHLLCISLFIIINARVIHYTATEKDRREREKEKHVEKQY